MRPLLVLATLLFTAVAGHAADVTLRPNGLGGYTIVRDGKTVGSAMPNHLTGGYDYADSAGMSVGSSVANPLTGGYDFEDSAGMTTGSYAPDGLGTGGYLRNRGGIRTHRVETQPAIGTTTIEPYGFQQEPAPDPWP